MIKLVFNNVKIINFFYKHRILRKFIKENILTLPFMRDKHLQSRVISFMWVSDGTSKQTQTGRFNDLDDKLLNYINKDKIINLHDIAVSSGITSIELKNKIKDYKINFYISDKYSIYYYQKNKYLTKIYDHNQELIFGNFGILSAEKNISKKYFLSILLYNLISKIEIRTEKKEFLFLDENVLKKIDTGEINYIYYDVFSSKIINTFDFVRCMNILNPTYFTEKQLLSAMKNIIDSMRENGVLLIGRTIRELEINSASFYIKKGNTLILLEHINDGTELKDLINSIQ